MCLVVVFVDVAAQASGGLLSCLVGGDSYDDFGKVFLTVCGWHLSAVMALAWDRLFRRLLAVLELRGDAFPTARAHQSAVDVARRLLAVAHCVGDVGGTRDQVATGVELAAAGLERVAVDFDRSVFAN